MIIRKVTRGEDKIQNSKYPAGTPRANKIQKPEKQWFWEFEG